MVLQKEHFMSAHWSCAFLWKLLRIKGKQTHFFLCSTVSSFAASPKSPNLRSMFSFTKKLPEKTSYSTIKPTELMDVILGLKQQAKKSQKLYLVWGLYGGCLCCGGIWAQIWSVWGSNGLLDLSMYVLLSKCVPETENMKHRIRVSALFSSNVNIRGLSLVKQLTFLLQSSRKM